MTSVFYPLHKKDVRIKVIGRSKYAGICGKITQDARSNVQARFNVKLDDGRTMSLHAESLQII